MATGPGYALGEIAHVLNARLEGDPTRIVTGVAPLESAGPGEISFLIDARHRAAARASRAGALVAEPGVDGLPAAVLRTARPQQALIDLLRLFHPPAPRSPGVHPTAVVAADVRIDATAGVGPLAVIEAGATVGPRVRIHALVYVGPGVEIGEDSEIHPHVTLRGGVRLGRRVVIHAGAVLGADGFGYAFDGQQHRKIPQVGGVVVEDDVEIGANTTIDRAMLGNTRVQRGAKLDNLVQVGHNVDVGEHAILVAQVGVSGSTRLGRGVVLAGQVGVADHVTIGDGAIVGAQSGVPGDVDAGARLLGSPARPARQARRILAAQTRLPDLLGEVRMLIRRLSQVEHRLGREERTGDAAG